MYSQTTKSEAFKLLALDQLSPTHHIIIEPAAVEWFSLAFIRVRVSELNRRNKMNLRVHKYKDGRVGVWYDPNPIPAKFKGIGLVDELIVVRREYAELSETINSLNSYTKIQALDKLIELNAKAEIIVAEMKRQSEDKTRKNKHGRIAQSLDVVLKHLGLTQDDWKLLPSYEQTRRWIKAEIEIRDKQRMETR